MQVRNSNKKKLQVRKYVFEKTAILLFSLITPQLNYPSNSIVWGGHFLSQCEIMITSCRSATKNLSMKLYRNSFLQSLWLWCSVVQVRNLDLHLLHSIWQMEAGDLFSINFSPSERPCRNSFRNYAATQNWPGELRGGRFAPCKGCLGGRWRRPNA